MQIRQLISYDPLVLCAGCLCLKQNACSVDWGHSWSAVNWLYSEQFFSVCVLCCSACRHNSPAAKTHRGARSHEASRVTLHLPRARHSGQLLSSSVRHQCKNKPTPTLDVTPHHTVITVHTRRDSSCSQRSLLTCRTRFCSTHAEIRSSFAFIFILNSVIINISFNYTKHDKYEVKIFFFKSTSLKDRMISHLLLCLNLTSFSRRLWYVPLINSALSYKMKPHTDNSSYIISHLQTEKN